MSAWRLPLALTTILLGIVGCGNERGPLQVQSGQGAVLSVSESPVYDFGSQLVEGSLDKTLTVTNVGTQDATEIRGSFNLSANFSYKGGSYPGSGGTCATRLAIQGTCSIVVSFGPKSVGVFDELVQITYHNGTTLQTTAAPQLRGKGTWDQPGSLDTTWQGSGKLVLSMGSGQDRARAIVIQNDGKILTAGNYHNGTSLDFLVTRHLADGRLDDGFGSNGKSIVGVGTGDDVAVAMALQQDGKVVVTGSYTSGAETGVAVIRLLTDGSLDSSFGSGGKTQFTSGTGSAEASGVTIQSDRRIVIAGYADNGAAKDVLVARLDMDGALDTGFGAGGKLLLDIGGSNDLARAVSYESGKILVTGQTWAGSHHDVFIMRVLESSALDSTFNGTGKNVVDIGSATDDIAHALRVQGDGKILVSGASRASDEDFAALRFLADGTLDSGFGASGRQVVAFGAASDKAHALALQQDKKIVLAGESNGSPALLRLLPGGGVDLGFGSHGKVVMSETGSFAGLALQANGKPLVAGFLSVGSDLDLLLARYWP